MPRATRKITRSQAGHGPGLDLLKKLLLDVAPKIVGPAVGELGDFVGRKFGSKAKSLLGNGTRQTMGAGASAFYPEVDLMFNPRIPPGRQGTMSGMGGRLAGGCNGCSASGNGPSKKKVAMPKQVRPKFEKMSKFNA